MFRVRQQQQQIFISVFPYKYMVLPGSNVVTIVMRPSAVLSRYTL